MHTSLCVNFRLPMGQLYHIEEGTFLSGLGYYDERGHERIVDGIVKRIDGRFVCERDPREVDSTGRPVIIEAVGRQVEATHLIVDCSVSYRADVRCVSIGSITRIGYVRAPGYTDKDIVIGIGPGYRSLEEVIEDAPDGSIIRLRDGVYEDEIVLNKSLAIMSDYNCHAELTGKVTIAGEGISVKLGALTMREDAVVDVQNASRVVIDDVTFKQHTAEILENNPMIYVKPGVKLLLSVTDCAYTDETAGSFREFIICNGTLMDGSTISRNSIDNNNLNAFMIVLNGIEDGARIDICDNWVSRSAPMIYMVNMDHPHGTVYMLGNRYDFASDNPAYVGLLCVESDKISGNTYKSLEIQIKDTFLEDNSQMAFLYQDDDENPWTLDNAPVCYVDGMLYPMPIVTTADTMP